MPKLIVDNENPEKQTDQFLITKEFSTSTEFSQFIEKKASSGSNYIDVLLDYCIRNEIEIESVKKLLTPSLKEKLKAEAQDLNLLKQNDKAKLPI
tara:strand:+ start:1436 stop:1720 length:285 start_codon:yes stop_codon:yes gene_type:complete